MTTVKSARWGDYFKLLDLIEASQINCTTQGKEWLQILNLKLQTGNGFKILNLILDLNWSICLSHGYGWTRPPTPTALPDSERNQSEFDQKNFLAAVGVFYSWIRSKNSNFQPIDQTSKNELHRQLQRLRLSPTDSNGRRFLPSDSIGKLRSLTDQLTKHPQSWWRKQLLMHRITISLLWSLR